MSLEALLAQGVRDHVYPLVRLEVFHRGRHVISAGNASPDCLFDLASLTKVMCTTALVLDTGLPLAAPISDFIPQAVVRASLEDLLFHRSGLPAFLPFFADEMLQHPELTQGPRPELRDQVRRAVVERVAATPPLAPVGAQMVYSDLGFILLGAALEAASRASLNLLFQKVWAVEARSGGGTAGFRRLSMALPLPVQLAPTGSTRPREPAPGQEGLWAVPEVPSALGEVDDDNAWCLDGVSGHAGLFGTALAVAHFGAAIAEGRWAPPTGWKVDVHTPNSTRVLGFDTPSQTGASCGQRFGRAGPKGAIGHLGFTGTSLWVDLDRQLSVALLTNRVALGRGNLRIREFRPAVHDAVLDELKL